MRSDSSKMYTFHCTECDSAPYCTRREMEDINCPTETFSILNFNKNNFQNGYAVYLVKLIKVVFLELFLTLFSNHAVSTKVIFFT